MAGRDDREEHWYQTTQLIAATSSFGQPVKGDSDIADPDKERSQRVQNAFQAYEEEKRSTKHQRNQMALGTKLQATYGKYIKINGNNLQGYRIADRYAALRLVRYMMKMGHLISKEQMTRIVLKISPSVTHLPASQSQQYVRDVVQQVWKSPDLAQMQLQAEEATRIMGSARKKEVATATSTDDQPQRQTRDVLSGTHPKSTSRRLSTPSSIHDYGRELYWRTVKNIKRTSDKQFDQQETDEQVVDKLRAKGHTKDQVREVLRHSPEIKTQDNTKKQEYIEAVIDRVERKIQDINRRDRESQHFNAMMMRKQLGRDIDM